MFELLPRMARYYPASGPQGQPSCGLCPLGAGTWAVEGGEEESRKGLESRVCWVFKEAELLATTGLPGSMSLH